MPLLQFGLTYDMRSKVKLMWSAVALVLLIGCVKIAPASCWRARQRGRAKSRRGWR